jgi:hypothetical protein
MQFDSVTNIDRKSGYLGRLWFVSIVFPEGRNRLTPAVTIAKSNGGASPHNFHPTYAEANVGHPPLILPTSVLTAGKR